MDFKIKNQSKIDIFTTIFQTIKGISEHIVIYFTDEKMFIQTMDSSKVSVLEIVILSSWFDFYSCQYDNIKFGINTNILYKILSSRDKTQTIHFEYNTEDDASNQEKLFVNMESIIEDKITKCIVDPSSEITSNEITTVGLKNHKDVYNRYFEVPLIDL